VSLGGGKFETQDFPKCEEPKGLEQIWIVRSKRVRVDMGHEDPEGEKSCSVETPEA
jgi:hypothetical protein